MGRNAFRLAAIAAVAVATIVPLAVPASANTYQTTSVVQASGPSPFANCDDSGQQGTITVNSELEPWVAVNPTDPSNIIGVYQQDRWSNGGAHGLVAAISHDGGQTWSHTWAHFSTCSGGTPENGGDYERASDPWISFSPGGDAYWISLSVDFFKDSLNGVLVSKSSDGGDHWSEPTTLVQNDASQAPFMFNDKESITADPFDSNFVYAIWDRSRFPSDSVSGSTGFSHAYRGDIIFTRTTDGGRTWEPARAIFHPRSNRFPIGDQITVLPDGTLVDIFDLGQGSGNNRPGFSEQAIISHDHGATWTAPIKIDDERAVATFDPDTGAGVRSGAGLPDVAVDLNSSSPGYGNLYAVWADAASTAKHHKGAYDSIVLSMSTDGGLTWTKKAEIDQSPGGVQAFTPSVDVAQDGTVGVDYYDFRNNTPDPGVPTDRWFIHCHPSTDCTNPSNWSENHVAGPFDIELAPVARGYFLGDYEGLDHVGLVFRSLFAQTTDSDPDNAYLATIAPV